MRKTGVRGRMAMWGIVAPTVTTLTIVVVLGRCYDENPTHDFSLLLVIAPYVPPRK